MTRRAMALVLGALVLAIAIPDHALLAAGCTITSSGPVAFGAYDVFSGTPLVTTGTISYSCTQPVLAPILKISAGQSASFAPRTLTSGPYTLGYNLFRDPALTQVWGDGTGGTYTYAGADPVNDQTYTATIYGRIPARQNVGAGSYGDSLTVTLDF